MSEPKSLAGLNRRDFLKRAGMIAGAAAVIPSLPAWTAVGRQQGEYAGRTSTLKVGVLAPKSNIYRNLGDSFIAGMRLHFKQAEKRLGGPKVEIITEDVGFGQRQAVIKARKLIQENEVDVVVGVVTPQVIAELRELINKNRTFFIVSGIGENAVRESERSPYVFYNTLNYWQANQAAGEWAAHNLGKKAFIAASHYDAGYDSFYAFRLGFENAGGEVVDTLVSHVTPDGDDMASLRESVEGASPDFIYASYCGEQSMEFLNAFERAGLKGRYPLLSSGFMVDDEILPFHGMSSRGIKSILPWSRSLNTPENREFVQAYERQTGRSADVFAVLGYDSAQLIHNASRAVGGDLSKTHNVVAALSNASFMSPRGRLDMDARTQSAITPLYLREVQGNGLSLSNYVIADLGPVRDSVGSGETQWSDVRTGWLNSYLSV